MHLSLEGIQVNRKSRCKAQRVACEHHHRALQSISLLFLIHLVTPVDESSQASRIELKFTLLIVTFVFLRWFTKGAMGESTFSLSLPASQATTVLWSMVRHPLHHRSRLLHRLHRRHPLAVRPLAAAIAAGRPAPPRSPRALATRAAPCRAGTPRAGHRGGRSGTCQSSTYSHRNINMIQQSCQPKRLTPTRSQIALARTRTLVQRSGCTRPRCARRTRAHCHPSPRPSSRSGSSL